MTIGLQEVLSKQRSEHGGGDNGGIIAVVLDVMTVV